MGAILVTTLPSPAGASVNASMPTVLHDAFPVAANTVSAIPATTAVASEMVSSTAAAASSGGNNTPATARASAAIPASAETTVAIFETARSACDHSVDAQWLTAVVKW